MEENNQQMTDDRLDDEQEIIETQRRKPKRWQIIIPILLIVIPIVLIAVIRPNFYFTVGGYSVEEVVLSSKAEGLQPTDIKTVFRPDENIICTVKTSGVDSIIGMKWYFGNQLINEATGRTRNNRIGSYIASNKQAILPEGKYHVDIYVGPKLVETVNFEIQVYHPEVTPPIATPAGHVDIEIPPWFTEIPFAFDEVWNIDGKDWKINEVKMMLSYNTDEHWVAVIVNSDVDHTGLSQSEVKQIARPIALYAIEKGYVDRARGYQIDGKHYAFDQYFFVTLINLQVGNKNAVQFTMDELE